MTSTTMELINKVHHMNHLMDKDYLEARAALEQRIKELEADAKRLDWMERQDWNTLDFLRPIDAPHDSECGVWSEDAGQYMFGKTAREAVDRAMSEAALTKAVEISQEYKLP